MTKYVISKLVSGEVLISELVTASQYSVTLKRPVQVRLVPTIKDGDIAEEPVISIYCQFTLDEEFEFKNDQVVYCKPLIEKIIPFYLKTADGLYNVEIANVTVKEYDRGIDALTEDETKLSIDDLVKSKILH